MTDPRVAKIQALIDHGATEGERAAARAAMERLKASGVNTDFPSKKSLDDFLRNMPRGFDTSDLYIQRLMRDLFNAQPTPPPPPPREQRLMALDARIMAIKSRIAHLEREIELAEQELAGVLRDRARVAQPPHQSHNGRVHWDKF